MKYDKHELYRLECRVEVYLEDILGMELYGPFNIERYEGKKNKYYIKVRASTYPKTPKQIIKQFEDALGIKGVKLYTERKDGKYREYYICDVTRDDLCKWDSMFKMMGFDKYGHNIHYRILAEKQKESIHLLNNKLLHKSSRV